MGVVAGILVGSAPPGLMPLSWTVLDAGGPVSDRKGMRRVDQGRIGPSASTDRDRCDPTGGGPQAIGQVAASVRSTV